MQIRSFAPGRVNLIGEHTDYTGGLVLPMALDMGITIEGEIGGDRLTLRSVQFDESFTRTLPIGADDDSLPEWAGYLTAAARFLHLAEGFSGTITSSLPKGGTGLSSSAALLVSAMLAFGALDEDTLDRRKQIARDVHEVELDATGLRNGLMDQLASIASIEGHATLINCGTLDIRPVKIPDSMDVLVFHSGQPRMLADSEYNARSDSAKQIQSLLGPLLDATLDDVATLADPMLQKRARHIVTENARVMQMIDAFAADDPEQCGAILNEGHRSLAEDYEVSTPIVDAIQQQVNNTPGVFGARMVGGGFGGSLVALAEPGTNLDVDTWWTRARPGPGASLTVLD